MKVETYEVEEITGEAGIMGADSEALQICRDLGLEGQLAIADTKTDTRFPYRRMTAVEKLVFETLCPQQTRLTKYHSGPIPVRVLQVAAYCKDSTVIQFIEVWHPEDLKIDPVLVGRTAGYEGEFYLLARWGEVLKPLEELQKDAAPIIADKLKKMLRDGISKANQRMEGAEEEALEAVTTGAISWPHFYA